jgi:MFS family permease
MARWVPSLERGRLFSFSSSSSQVGIITGLRLGIYLCVHGFAGGWPSIFYIFGLLNQCNCFKIKISFKKGRLAWFGVLRGFLSQVIRLMIINLLRIEKKNILLKK